MAKLTAQQIEETAKDVDCSARCNASADHSPDDSSWDECYRDTMEMALDGLSTNDFRCYSASLPRPLTPAEIRKVRVAISKL